MAGSTDNPLRATIAEGRTGFLAVAVFSFFLNLLMLVSPIYMMQVFDRVLSSGSTDTLIYLTLIALVAIAVLGALETLRNKVMSRVSLWMEQRLSGSLIATAVSGTLQGLNLGAQPLRDLAQVRAFIASPGLYALFDAPWVPLFVAVIWLMHPWLGMLALGSAVALFGLALANELVTRTPSKEASLLSIRSQGEAEAITRNAEVVQSMGLWPGLLNRWTRRNERILRLQEVAGDRGGLVVGFSKFLRLAVQIAILGIGAFLVLKGELTSGGMIAGSILLGRALAPVEQAIGTWKSLLQARSSYARLSQLLQRIPERKPGMPLPAPEGHLLVDRLSFVPPGGRKAVLKQVSFELMPGEALGIVGPSAAGKSTLCRLLVGIHPATAGHVRLDSADVASWHPDDLGPHLGYLPQDVELFAGTIRDNIARMTDAPPAAVVDAAMLAGVHDMVLHLGEGYDTEIGEYGQMLSAGQRQRIGLARALFNGPRLLVLDEPNANLDQEGELALVKAIEVMKKRGSTIVIVAHRPNVLTQVDKLLVLRDGVVEMFDERDKVTAQLSGLRRVKQGDPPQGPPRVVKAAG
jgi:PrtD family type I secretion system ABC transporter